MTIGILALQGDFSLHAKILDRLNIKNIYVKNIRELSECSALIIPGGESTVIYKMILNEKLLYKHLKIFARKHSVYGTCAGAIIMSSHVNDNIIKPLNLLNIKIKRNAWGTQINSFESNVMLKFSSKLFAANFIRAPKIKILDKKIRILSTYNKEPVLLRNKYHLVSSFHPELGNDTRIHKYFINMVKENE